MWKNIVEWGRPQMKVWHMCIACCIPKATDTHSGYVIHFALLLQHWSHEHASLLHCKYIVCLVML